MFWNDTPLGLEEMREANVRVNEMGLETQRADGLAFWCRYLISFIDQLIKQYSLKGPYCITKFDMCAFFERLASFFGRIL
jgi:hypothetical protein